MPKLTYEINHDYKYALLYCLAVVEICHEINHDYKYEFGIRLFVRLGKYLCFLKIHGDDLNA